MITQIDGIDTEYILENYMVNATSPSDAYITFIFSQESERISNKYQMTKKFSTSYFTDDVLDEDRIYAELEAELIK